MNGYTVEEAARILGIPTERVWDLVARGIFSGARGEDGTWRVHLGGPPTVPAQGPADGGTAPGRTAGGRQRRGETRSADSSDGELSPFRELLTEFRHLTERYGQALLALGEARGEVAALTSRVSALETRVDLRLPFAEVASGVSAAPPLTVAEADSDAVPAAVVAAPPPVDLPEAAQAQSDETAEEATADAEPAEAVPVGEVDAPAHADESADDLAVQPDEAAPEEADAAPDEAVTAEAAPAPEEAAAAPEEAVTADDAVSADEAVTAPEAAEAEPAMPVESAGEGDQPDAGESGGDGSDGGGLGDGAPEDRSPEGGAPEIAPVAASEQESEEVAAVAEEVEAQAPADEPQAEDATGSTEADALRDLSDTTEVGASRGAEQEMGEPPLPDDELPSAELPADDEEFETIDDLLVLARDEEPETSDTEPAAEPEQAEPEAALAEPGDHVDAVAAPSAAQEAEVEPSSLTAFGVEGGDPEPAQPRRANRLGSEIAAALARADDPSPPELPNGTNGSEQAAERLVTEPEPATRHAEPEPSTPVDDDAQYAAEMEVGSAGWHRVTATTPADAPEAAEHRPRPSERLASTATALETRSTRGLAIDPYPDQNELINALGWEQDEIDAIRSLLAGQAPMTGARAPWPQADPDARTSDAPDETRAEAPSAELDAGADAVAASETGMDERGSEPAEEPAVTDPEAPAIRAEAVGIAIDEPAAGEASDEESPDMAEALAEPAAPSGTPEEAVSATQPATAEEPASATRPASAEEPASAEQPATAEEPTSAERPATPEERITASEAPEPTDAAPTFEPDAPATLEVAPASEATPSDEPSPPTEGAKASTDEDATLPARAWPPADRAGREGADRARSGGPPFELPGSADLDAALEALRRRSSEEAAAEEQGTARAHRGEVTIGHSPATPEADRGTPATGEPELRHGGLDEAAWSRRSPAANAYRRLRRFLGG